MVTVLVALIAVGPWMLGNAISGAGLVWTFEALYIIGAVWLVACAATAPDRCGKSGIIGQRWPVLARRGCTRTLDTSDTAPAPSATGRSARRSAATRRSKSPRS